MKQVLVGHQILLQVVKQDEVNVVQAHVGHEAPQREGKELGHPLAPRRVPRRGEGQGEHDGAEYHHDGHEDALRHEDAVVGHLENQLSHEADDIVYPFADLGLRGHHRPLGVVVDGVAKVLHVVDEFVPPCGVLSDGGHLLRGRDGILHGAQPVKVLALFLSHLQLEGGHLLVLGLRHRLARAFKSLAGHLQGVTYPRGGRDADGDADDAEELHYVHAAPSEHHHPALVGTHAEGEQQPDDTGQSHRVAQHSHVGERLHGDKQLVQALVDGRKAYGQ